VRVLDLTRASTTEDRGSITHLSSGILMPHYPATLNEIPSPIRQEYALAVLQTMESTLRFVHEKGWIHGDVKPSNIFVDKEGEVWLGDYGSSKGLSELPSFPGGTLALRGYPSRAPTRV
jgi:serine/threonine protein kinase